MTEINQKELKRVKDAIEQTCEYFNVGWPFPVGFVTHNKKRDGVLVDGAKKLCIVVAVQNAIGLPYRYMRQLSNHERGDSVVSYYKSRWRDIYEVNEAFRVLADEVTDYALKNFATPDKGSESKHYISRGDYAPELCDRIVRESERYFRMNISSSTYRPNNTTDVRCMITKYVHEHHRGMIDMSYLMIKLGRDRTMQYSYLDMFDSRHMTESAFRSKYALYEAYIKNFTSSGMDNVLVVNESAVSRIVEMARQNPEMSVKKILEKVA